MGRILEDARALLDVDRERLSMMREAQSVNESALATARELAQIGEQERPKAEKFVQGMKEAASIAPRPGTGPALPTDTTRTSSSTGGSGTAAAGGGSAGTTGLLRSQGGTVRTRGWVADNCTRTTVMIPRPGSFRADDKIEVEAWDCSVPFFELGLPTEDGAAIFIDPGSATRGLARSSSSHSGGGASGGSGKGTLRQQMGRANVLGSTGPVNSNLLTGSSTAMMSPGAPTADGKLVAHTLREVGREIVKSVREGGDLGLQIRRNGGI